MERSILFRNFSIVCKYVVLFEDKKCFGWKEGKVYIRLCF